MSLSAEPRLELRGSGQPGPTSVHEGIDSPRRGAPVHHLGSLSAAEGPEVRCLLRLRPRRSSVRKIRGSGTSRGPRPEDMACYLPPNGILDAMTSGKRFKRSAAALPRVPWRVHFFRRHPGDVPHRRFAPGPSRREPHQGERHDDRSRSRGRGRPAASIQRRQQVGSDAQQDEWGLRGDEIGRSMSLAAS